VCGIAGFVDFSGIDRNSARARVLRMTNSLIHRGPDEGGTFVDACAALGHRRLSIIDLGSGQQPMASADGRYAIVFNGEIYNFRELRSELEAKGICFRTRSDTEVILAAYAEWADDCVERLAGMFAFAIWDARERRLFLARDRVGKKPLYFCRDGSRFAFASELKALMMADVASDRLDPEAIDCYFTFGYIPAPRTIYRGVAKLPSARCVTVSQAGQNERSYWSLGSSPLTTQSFHEAVEEFESLLDSAVASRLLSEVPLGAFLSGGLDSSLVVAAMARCMNRPVITNSIGFAGHGNDELPLARLVAEQLHTDHREHVVSPESADVLGRIAWHFDEPLADSSALPTWYVCQMARRSVTVALSGDGGDEAFGGYTFRYIPHLWESKARARIPALVRGSLFGALGVQNLKDCLGPCD
jgi:asparagine synthase (glutamine-hydrolysing)